MTNIKIQTIPISVVMITYNHEKYIAESIQSVLNQTFSNFEFIIVNDGSTDTTEEIIKSFKDKRIKYIKQANQGPSAARNTAISMASGIYLAQISGDDVCKSERLQVQYDFLRSSGKKIAFSRCELIDDNSQLIKDYENHIFNKKIPPNRKSTLQYFFFSGNFLCAPSAMIEKEVFLKYGLYSPALIQLQDYEMWIRLAKNYDIEILENKLTQYRIRDNNKNLSYKPENQGRMIFEWIQILRCFFKDMSSDSFKEFFSEFLVKKDFSTNQDFDIEKAFLYTHHTDPHIRIIGAEKLFSYMSDTAKRTYLTRSYEFDLSRYFNFLHKIDPANNQLRESYNESLNSYNQLNALFREVCASHAKIASDLNELKANILSRSFLFLLRHFNRFLAATKRMGLKFLP